MDYYVIEISAAVRARSTRAQLRYELAEVCREIQGEEIKMFYAALLNYKDSYHGKTRVMFFSAVPAFFIPA